MGWIPSKEVRQKISLTLMGRPTGPRSPETKLRNLTVSVKILQEQNAELKRKINRQGAQINSVRSKL